jgi:hypothetical protein
MSGLRRELDLDRARSYFARVPKGDIGELFDHVVAQAS